MRTILNLRYYKILLKVLTITPRYAKILLSKKTNVKSGSKGVEGMGKIYGYCRISKPTQNIDRQERNIKEKYEDAIIKKEAFTGTKVYERKKFNKLIHEVQPGDSIVFDSVSRMSRDAAEGVKIYLDLYGKGVNLIFLKEPHINTDTYKKALENNISMTGTNVDFILEGINKYLISLAREQIKIAFDQAQKEVDDLHQRTKEGLKTARDNGKQIGQKPGSRLNIKKKEPIKQLIRKHNRDFSGSLKDADTISVINGTEYNDKDGNKKKYHVSNNTYYKYKRELAQELNN